eukprot:4465777-Prymnesium_polylepis.1
MRCTPPELQRAGLYTTVAAALHTGEHRLVGLSAALLQLCQPPKPSMVLQPAEGAERTGWHRTLALRRASSAALFVLRRSSAAAPDGAGLGAAIIQRSPRPWGTDARTGIAKSAWDWKGRVGRALGLGRRNLAESRVTPGVLGADRSRSPHSRGDRDVERV